MASRTVALRRAVALLVLAAVAVAALPSAAPSDQGVFGAEERGCYCHGPVASPTVGFSVEGLPGHYAPGANYTLWINVTFTDVLPVANRSQGGFSIIASAGNFSDPEGSGLVHALGNEVTHTPNGTRARRWVVNWTAPAEPDLVVTFAFYVNTVNGNRSETLGSDHWTMKTATIGVGDAPVFEGPPPPVQHQALETYGALGVGIVGALVMLYLFKSSARPKPPQPKE